MKELSTKRRLIFVILLGSVAVCLFLGLRVRQVTCDNVYLLSFAQDNKSFVDSDISIAEDSGISFTYMKYLYPEISNGFRIEKATVIATNDNYSFFSGTQIRSGAFFNSVHEERKMAVAVLNEAAAYQMFGNYDCIGERIYLNQNAFDVIGIVKECGNVDVAKIYVPERTTEVLGIVGPEANQLWCRFANMAEAAMAISKMGYSLDELDITQMDLYKGVFMQRFLVLVIWIGLFPFVRVMLKVWYKTKELRQSTKKDKTWYMKWILQDVVCIVGLIIMLKVVRLSWIVPPNYDVIGKSWSDVLYEVLEFYTLFGIEIDRMYFLNQWNLVSLVCMVVCMVLGGIITNYSAIKNSNGTVL